MVCLGGGNDGGGGGRGGSGTKKKKRLDVLISGKKHGSSSGTKIGSGINTKRRQVYVRTRYGKARRRAEPVRACVGTVRCARASSGTQRKRWSNTSSSTVVVAIPGATPAEAQQQWQQWRAPLIVLCFYVVVLISLADKQLHPPPPPSTHTPARPFVALLATKINRRDKE